MKTIVTFGEIMLRLKTPEFQRFQQTQSFEAVFGGGEANVAASLAQFGLPVEFVTRLPLNELGDACVSFVRQQGVGTRHILRGGERQGIYFLENGAAQRASKIIYDRTNSSFSTLQRGMVKWDEVFTAAGWFHWTGITPAVSEGAANVCYEAVETAHRLGLTVSCDLNYRAKLWQWTRSPADVMSDLVSGCDVVIANEEDADKVFGIKAPQADVRASQVRGEKYQFVCEALAKRFPNLTIIAITLRGSLSASHNTWSGVLWADGSFHQAALYDVLPIVDRVGAGDAFAAGLIYGLLMHPGDAVYALDFATAASCLKHSIPGDFNRVSVNEVEQLMGGDASGRVVR